MIKIIPFLEKRYESKLGKSQILDSIRQKVNAPDWNVSMAKLMNRNHQILEDEVVNNEFIISKEKYGVTYGKANFLPILKGIVRADPPGDKTLVKIVIRPSLFVVISYVFLVFIMGTLFRFGLQKSQYDVSVMSSFFILGPYISIMFRFNRAVNVYLRFIEEDILNQF